MRGMLMGMALAGFVLAFVTGSPVSIADPAYGFTQSEGVNQLTFGQTASRPVVKNGRIAWYVGTGTTTPTVGVMLADLRGGGPPSIVEIVRDAEAVFTGPPDLDEHGNVVYVKRVSGRHQVFLFDGSSHLQLTENPAIPGSPVIGLGTDKVSPGWPRVANQHVVFRDGAGNVFLYDPNLRSIRPINRTAGETANTSDGRIRSPIYAEVKEFEFDGRHIVWLHEDVITERLESNMTVYLAEPPYEAPRKLTEFRAWIPVGAPLGTGAIGYPFFVACADKVAWQYYPRTVPNEVNIGYHDGTAARAIRNASPVLVQSLRIHKEQLAWIETPPRPVDADKVFLYDGAQILELASLPDPPGIAPVGTRFWTGIHDVEIFLGEVVWLAREVECRGLVPPLCTALPTNRQAIFSSRGGSSPVVEFVAQGGAGVADFDNGIYSFRAGFQPTSSDVAYYQVSETRTDTNATLILTDTTHEAVSVGRAGERTVAVDGFKLSVTAKDCGGEVTEGVSVSSLAFDANPLTDNAAKIRSGQLFDDADANGLLSPGDILLSEAMFPADSSTLTFTLGTPITITPGGEKHLLLVYLLAEPVCPCQYYPSTLSASGIQSTTTMTQTTPIVTGGPSTGLAVVDPLKQDDLLVVSGDDQTGCLDSKLAKELVMKVKGFPAKCGNAVFQITSPSPTTATLDGGGTMAAVPFVQDGQDATAKTGLTLGKEISEYVITVTVDFEGPTVGTQCHNLQTMFKESAVEADLNIHKPKVIDRAEAVVSDELEEVLGAQTFVNLDNDDRDEAFDYDDMDGVVGEDELCLVELKLRPITLDQGAVQLEALSGAADIKVWGKSDRTEAVGLPKMLSVAGDFKLEGDALVKKVWVEGIKPHTSRRSVRLKMAYQAEPGNICTDEVALTILGVKSQTWLGLRNGFTAGATTHDNDVLDADPNFPNAMTDPRSNRVFAGARAPDFNTARDRVELEVELTVAPVEAVKLFIRSFDVDDPSADTDFVDPNDSGAAMGEYSGTAIKYTRQEDNRGVPAPGSGPDGMPGTADDSPGHAAGDFEGQDDDGIATLNFSPADTKKKVEFSVSHHPGDNYRAVVSGDKDFLIRLRNEDVNDGARIVHPAVAGGEDQREIREAFDPMTRQARYASNVLTVWRLLHVENDSMEAVHRAGPESIQVEGNIVGISGFATASRLELSVDLSLGLPNGPDPSINRQTGGTGRFEGGSILIGTDRLRTNNLDANGDQFVEHAAFNIPFVAARAPQPNVMGRIIRQTGQTLTTSGGVVTADYIGGTLTIAGVPFTISAVNPPVQSVTVNQPPVIPFVLTDDDGFVLPNDSNLTGLAAYQAADVHAVNDGGGGQHNDQTVPFVLNGPNTQAGEVAMYNANRGSAGNETDLFWVVYVGSGWQDVNTEDVDPGGEGGITGSTSGGGVHNINLALGGDGALIWREAERDAVQSGYKFGGHSVNVAHEVGHQFGLGHGDANSPGGQVNEFPNVGLMHPTLTSPMTPGALSLRHVNLVRSRVRSPGEQPPQQP
ncbi:MAG: hypothetical protein HY650_04520 [Acidobacteria bacterium]|nr:hypothetical protein [Acidobacteriota bacterium]